MPVRDALLRRLAKRLGVMPADTVRRQVARELDVDYYADAYPDLRPFDKRQLVRHYVQYGRAEGRFGSRAIMLAYFRGRGIEPPVDFKPRVYAQLNPDLKAKFDTDAEFELHFLRHGLEEDRPYVVDAEDKSSDWKTIFSLQDFLAYSKPWRTQPTMSFAEATALFEAEGISRLVPIHRDWAFDPHFYRQNYQLRATDPAELYRHWLYEGFADGLAPNEIRAIVKFMQERDYPQCFNWKRYSRYSLFSRTTYPRKTRALRSLFEAPLKQRAITNVDGSGSAILYRFIGDYQFSRDFFECADVCYGRAADAGVKSSTLHLNRGDSRRNLGRLDGALQDYLAAMTFPGYSVRALANAAEVFVELGRAPEAFELLVNGQKSWAGDPRFRAAVSECVNRYFQEVSGKARDCIRAGDRGAAEANFANELARLTELIDRLLVGAPRSIAKEPDRVVMLACLDLPQCTHYRVNQKVEQFAKRGVTLEVFDFNFPEKFMQSAPGAAAAIFYRVPAYPAIVEVILYARALGLETYYDIDDLIFSDHFPDSYESYENTISLDEYVGLQHGVTLYRHAIGLCDRGIASTDALAAQLAPAVRTKLAHVIPNGLDSTNQLPLMLAGAPKLSTDRVTIFYGSGTKAHNADFNTIVAPALVALLEKYEYLHLLIVGYLKLGESFAKFESRIRCLTFIDNVSQYWSVLSACDINISVLKRDPVTDCKSEIKWLEAAVLSIPSVVSDTSTFATVLKPPHDGLLAKDTSEWVRHLSALIEDPSLRSKIGAAARRKALQRYALEAVSARLPSMFPFMATTAANDKSVAVSPPPQRKRVLICNVFFAPQTYGGATRVVEANVDYLLENAGDDFEIGILTTDVAAPEGQMRVDAYRGCPVFRISTPMERNMDWRPFNEDNVDRYRKVLEMFSPDLVHFHCIQRLTASVVEETLERGIPYLVTVHDGWWISDYQFLVDQFEQLIEIDRDDRPHALPRGVTAGQSIERRQRLAALLNRGETTAAVSQAFAKIYEKAGIRNVVTIENGVTALPPPLPSQTSKERLVLGHVGGRSVHKGAGLIEVALKNGNFDKLELIMIDPTVEFGGEVEVYWGKSRVRLHGNYPQSRVNELFASFDVLLAPSVWPESYGLVSREAAYYGKYVVASDRGAIGDVIGNGAPGVRIDVSDIEALTQLLGTMNADITVFKPAAHQRPLLRSADEQAIELSALYRRIAEGATSPAAAGSVSQMAE